MDENWEQRILEAAPLKIRLIRAHTFRRAWESASRPRQLVCEDGHDYVVKGSHLKRTVVNDRLVGLLGHAIDAPIPRLALIDVPEELAQAEPRIAPIRAGIHHGTRYVPGTRDDREEFAPTALDVNRARFATLAVLYGWIGANDHQVIYLKDSPQLVYSVDHGHFFPNGPDWTISALQTAGVATPDQTVINKCGLNTNDVRAACTDLRSAGPDRIAKSIAMVPDEWWDDRNERVAMAVYLEGRRQALLSQHELA